MRPRRAMVWCCLIVPSAGCGGPAGDDPTRPEAVTASVDLPTDEAGVPDAGSRAGHGADLAAVTGEALFGFTGRVAPPDSQVVARVVGGAAGSAVVEPSGRFSVAVGGLRRGSNVVRLRATRDGHRPWTRDVRVTRATAPVVAVPEKDATPPVAVLRLRPTDDAPGKLSVSPSAPGDRHEHVALTEPRLHATALVRDEGGAGRIRFSTTYQARCGTTVRPRHVSLPPAQIVNVRLAPGAEVPVEETRKVTLPLPDERGCRITGEAWAEATDGHGLQAVTRHIAFTYP